eukprot:Skav208704  [mRNA]  locus=scaffold42:439639:444144:- [translate_table: standard]
MFEVVLQKQTAPGMFAGAITCLGGSEVVVHVSSSIAQHVSRCSSITIVNPVVRTIEAVVHLHVDDAKGLVLLHPAVARGSYRVAELFGGLGGWSYASQHAGIHPVAIVDVDGKVCHACAKAFGTTVMSVDEFYQHALDTCEHAEHVKPVVVHCTIYETKLWAALTLLNVAVILASPPCQPWSTTGRQGGLSTPEGLLFCSLLDRAAACRMHAVVCENVVGFPNHADYQDVLAQAAVKGLKLVDGGLIACQRLVPVIRNRWLGVFMHVSIQIEPDLVKKVKDMCMPTMVCQVPALGPSLAEADALHVNMSPTESELLRPSDHAISMMKRYELAPRWLLDKVDTRNAEPVLQSRILGPNEKLSGVMASYGSQHLLPINLLREKGMHTMLCGTYPEYRYFSPWEILASMGFPETVWLDVDVKGAFQQSGNALSPVHAGFAIAKAHQLLGPLSPFQVALPIGEFVQEIANAAARLSKYRVVVEGDLCGLVLLAEPDVPDEPVSKKHKAGEVSPTVAFHLDPQLGGTVGLDFDPNFDMPSNAGLCIPTSAANGGLIMLRHHERHWMIVVHGAPEEILANAVQRALPHANESHFVRFFDEHATVLWDQRINCVPCKSISFEPHVTAYVCEMDHGVAYSMNGDLTWTVGTMKAFVAAAMKCNCDALRVFANDLPAHDTDYLDEYETTKFVGKFKACMPRYFSFAPRESTALMSDMSPREPATFRFVAKHPLKKVTRSIVVSDAADVGTVVRTLFPDMCEQASWTVSCGGQPVGSMMPICDLLNFTIDWHCFRPLAPTKVDKVTLLSAVDSGTMQVKYALHPQRWIKSPLQSRATVIRVDEALDLKQIVASYVIHTQMSINVTCHLGGHILDPDTVLRDVPVDQVISFCLAPLLGGAKQHEQLRARVKALLESHGVATNASLDRANAFLNKADAEVINKVLAEDDASVWQTVKDEANRVHFRLVYRNELNEAKKTGRAKPPNKFQKPPKAAPKKDEFVASATNIKIDIDHFWDGENHVQLLDSSRFGQDRSGLAIMSRAEADKHDCSQTISMDALAILIVGKSFAPTDEPFMMPAYTCQGQPIIIQAALRQYGDRHVTFQAAVPMLEVGRTAATTLEIHIMKSEVVAWRECGVPLHYLGVQISAVRGSSLISAWAMKTFSADRKPVPFRDAAYWHGYVKVEDAILEQVLSRSGWAGIYVTPRTPEKKLDDRFMVIAVPDCSLGDLQKKVATIDKALGIVRIKDQLAVRCRREHASQVRSVLLPESAYVASNTFDHQDSLWLLKNLPCEIGEQGLSQALTKAGWEARPIRAQGQNRWLIASKADPPSMHLLINQSYVLVEPAKRSHESASVTMVAKQFKVDTVMTSNNGVTQVATTSRFQEIKTEMSEQMEAKLLDANQRIEQLQSALGQMQQFQQAQASANQATQQELAQLKEEQAFARQKITEVESSVVASGQTVIQTMQTMMQSMQQNLEASMKQIVAAEAWSESEKEKRARTAGTPPKHDVFATKS